MGGQERESDVLVVGGGANGLICALLLARSGLSVEVLEDKPALGGMHRTEFPFAKAPRLPAFPGAHRAGVVPRELETQLVVALPAPAKAPALFVPTATAGRYALVHGASTAPELGGLASGDARGLTAMLAELDALASDVAPVWLAAGKASIEDVAERYVRAPLRASFVALCRGSFDDYVGRFEIGSELVKAALAADALDGSSSATDAPGSGAPLLVRHAARARGVVAVGPLLRTIAERAREAGVTISTGAAVTQIEVAGNAVTGVTLADGRSIRAGAVVSSADPWRLRALLGTDRLPSETNRRVEALGRASSVAKLSLALRDLPRFASLGGDRGQHRATTLVIPADEAEAMRVLGAARADAGAGRLPSAPILQCVFPSASDEALRDGEGRHGASILVPWAPYDLVGTTWSAEEERFTNAVLDVLERVAPGVRSLVSDAVLYHPKKLETQLGVTGGQLDHVDDTHLFGDRLPPTTPIRGLYLCGRACGSAAGVFGAGGVQAFQHVLADLELALERTEIGIRES